MRSRKREGPSTFLTIVFSFCTALIIFAVLRSFIGDPAPEKSKEIAKPIILDEGKVHDLPKMVLETVAAPTPVVPIVESPVPQPILVTGEEQKHVVKDKETLSSISKKYYGTETKWEKIWEANKTTIPNKNRIRPGITLIIPDLEKA